MNTDELRLGTDQVTEQIIGCALKVSNGLGIGFPEKVYENALAVELRRAGLVVAQQRELKVHYEGVLVGSFAVDLLVEDRVIVELKVARYLEEAHTAQCLNYLRVADAEVCLLLNFGNPRLEIKRLVY
jgi:GxxExxY protein